MPADRLMPTEEAQDLIELTREICAEQLAPKAPAAEAAAEFPRDTFRLLGDAGLLSLAYPEEVGGGGQPYEVYLQVVEEIAAAWMSVAVGVSVHSLTCYPVAQFGTDAQKAGLLPDMLGGSMLGAYCLSEPQAGSDVSAISTRATPLGDGSAYRLKGTKAWISHAGHADFYTTFARTGDHPSKGLSCFVVPAGTEGLSFGEPERKMGLACDTVRQVYFEDAVVDAGRLVGEPGMGMSIALSALDSGRLGIAAAATGLAQAALDVAAGYATERKQFGRAISEFQGLSFLLADMEAAVTSARATYLHAARLRDAGRPFSKQAAIAKLVCTDAAMKVTTDAVQVLGGYGYTQDFPVERYMREAKVTQIFEGTNQIQRLVIARQLLRG
ncbi:alkylation response protein AidB-like acyl-CoA dehydrogenase [Oryzihumus leptocrescens]|uniref:Alkylation response protein AidB-like acyl-CoA dehydrogenase n=2 Tax=Oryzihumus leptocrescens TaxID=297536 RepID=A0A542ZES1_9MICO|nr:acyl-CoA dehydrogenase family protein [Oryzihumus leptocrescens]TQL58835.1 alkylation response protein AidB-like acyl-CoA dehydrogenase [Oryzihumus leptocrescens]